MFKLDYKTNPFVHMLVVDVLPDDCLASYECDIDIERVIVGKTPNDHSVQVQNFGDHCCVHPFAMESEEQFNTLAIEAIIEAQRCGGKPTVCTLYDAQHFLEEDIDCGKVSCLLVSPEDKADGIFMMSVLRELGDYVAMRKTYAFKQIPKGTAYAIPDPEFLGVIAESKVSEEERHYGIGIINTKAVIKVRFRTIDTVSAVLFDLMAGISELEQNGKIAIYGTDYWLLKLMMPRIKDAHAKLDVIIGEKDGYDV